MLKKDYIVRQLEEFGKVLGVLMFLKKEKDWEKFEKEIATASSTFTNIELDYVENIGLAEYSQEILVNGKVSLEQKKILANLLFEKIDYYKLTQENEKHKKLVEKCYRLYEYLQNDQTQNEFNLEVHYRLEILKNVRLNSS